MWRLQQHAYVWRTPFIIGIDLCGRDVSGDSSYYDKFTWTWSRPRRPFYVAVHILNLLKFAYNKNGCIRNHYLFSEPNLDSSATASEACSYYSHCLTRARIPYTLRNTFIWCVCLWGSVMSLYSLSVRCHALSTSPIALTIFQHWTFTCYHDTDVFTCLGSTIAKLKAYIISYVQPSGLCR